MLLSNATIRKRLASGGIVVRPLDDQAIQPCSVDVHLGETMLRWEGPRLDPRLDNSRWWRPYPPMRGPDGAWYWVLVPGRFYLGVLAEYIKLPSDLCGHLWNTSTEARNGFLPHLVAGLLDPGWGGHATTEMVVFAAPTVVRPGQRVGQVEFIQLDTPADPPYQGRYAEDDAPTPARATHQGGQHVG